MKVFYYDYYTEKGIETEKAKTSELKHVLELFYKLNDVKNNFLGIIDKNENTIQFMFLEQDKWLVEIPNDDNCNYQMYANYNECADLIEKSYLIDEIVLHTKMRKVNIIIEALDDID